MHRSFDSIVACAPTALKMTRGNHSRGKFPESAWVESSSSGFLSRRHSASRNSDSARNDTGLEHLMIAWHQTELGHPTEAWATQPCRFRAFAFRRWHAASRLMTSYDIVFLYDIVIPYDIVFLCHSERWRSVCDGERGTPGMLAV